MGNFETWGLLKRCDGTILSEGSVWDCCFLCLSQLNYFLTHNYFIKIKQLRVTLETPRDSFTHRSPPI